jgi:RNA polymerase sigma-70 factor (ECF subfamily)
MMTGEGQAAAQDERLIIEAAQRDPARFAELYDGHFHRIYAYVVRRVGSRAEAEDVTAEVFHSALEKLPRFEWRGVPFAAWLFRIASNAVADHFARLSKERGVPAPEGSAEADFEEAGDRARIFRLVAELPEDQRRVIRMRFSEEKSIRDVASALGRSEGAVKQLQFRALQGLRERMKEPHV